MRTFAFLWMLFFPAFALADLPPQDDGVVRTIRYSENFGAQFKAMAQEMAEELRSRGCLNASVLMLPHGSDAAVIIVVCTKWKP